MPDCNNIYYPFMGITYDSYGGVSRGIWGEDGRERWANHTQQVSLPKRKCLGGVEQASAHAEPKADCGHGLNGWWALGDDRLMGCG